MKAPPQFGRAPECKGTTVVTTLQAWPQCESAEEECELNAAETLAYECERQARDMEAKENKDSKYEILNSEIKTAAKLESNIKDIHQAYNDPIKFTADKIGSKINASVAQELGLSSGSLTGKGERLVGETYEYLFGNTVGNRYLRSSNPIISAIQGSTADQIKRNFNQTLLQSQRLSEMIGQISSNEQRGSSSRAVSTVGAADCAILQSQGRTDFAEDRPAEYSSLLARCSKR